MDPLGELKEMAESKGGSMTVHEIKNEAGEVVHSFGTMSMPLRKDHWIYQKGADGFSFPPPMPLRMGAGEEIRIDVAEHPSDPEWVPNEIEFRLTRQQMAEMIRAAGKYAVRSATMHGEEMDFDPDALLQNLVCGFLGYWTADGLSGDDWANPKEPWTPGPPPAQPETTNGNSVATGSAPQV